nr:rna polymerase ii c-terminal domain phosphatase-like 4 [Quercus suber]
MKIISERDFPQDDHYDDFDDTPEENTEETCAHLCVIRGKCVSCERVALKYVHQGMWLWLNKDEMDRIRKVESAKLLEDKKMVLVLDLDQTLVHSTEQRKCLRTPQELLQHNLRDSLFRSVWSKHPFNLIHIKRYRYFDSDPDSWSADEVELIAILQRLNVAACLTPADIATVDILHNRITGCELESSIVCPNGPRN